MFLYRVNRKKKSEEIFKGKVKKFRQNYQKSHKKVRDDCKEKMTVGGVSVSVYKIQKYTIVRKKPWVKT